MTTEAVLAAVKEIDISKIRREPATLPVTLELQGQGSPLKTLAFMDNGACRSFVMILKHSSTKLKSNSTRIQIADGSYVETLGEATCLINLREFGCLTTPIQVLKVKALPLPRSICSDLHTLMLAGRDLIYAFMIDVDFSGNIVKHSRVETSESAFYTVSGIQNTLVETRKPSVYTESAIKNTLVEARSSPVYTVANPFFENMDESIVETLDRNRLESRPVESMVKSKACQKWTFSGR